MFNLFCKHSLRHQHSDSESPGRKHQRRCCSDNDTHSEHAQHHEDHEHGGCRRNHGHDKQMKLRRLFEHGDLRLVLLAFVAKNPSHGYELIKSIEEATAGLYTPSPGVIYPTLTYLEEMEYVESSSSEKGRKSYQITLLGEVFLKENQTTVDAIFERLNHGSHRHENNLAQEIEESIGRLRALLRHHLIRKELTALQISNIAAILNDTVQQIDAEMQINEK